MRRQISSKFLAGIAAMSAPPPLPPPPPAGVASRWFYSQKFIVGRSFIHK